MNPKKRPYVEPVISDPIDLRGPGQSFPLMPLMGAGSAGGGDGFFPGAGADGAQDSGGDGASGSDAGGGD